MEEINPLEYSTVVWDTAGTSPQIHDSLPTSMQQMSLSPGGASSLSYGSLPSVPSGAMGGADAIYGFAAAERLTTGVVGDGPLHGYERVAGESNNSAPPMAAAAPDPPPSLISPLYGAVSYHNVTFHQLYRIEVSDPQKHGEGMKDAHVSYFVRSRNSSTGIDSVVRRRFTDFVWLHGQLAHEYPASIVPPLPEKHRMEYITGDRFSAEFVEKRRSSLQRFLMRVARHPALQRSSDLKSFLNSADWNLELLNRTKKEGVFDNLSDALLNAFAKLKKPDERFVEIKEVVSRFEESLTVLERVYSRIVKKHLELEQDYSEFGAGLTSLGVMETDMTDPLTKVGGVFYEFSKTLSFMISQEDVELIAYLREYLTYCHAVKYSLKLRDQKQLDFEELVEYLGRHRQERERASVPGRAPQTIGGFIKDKFDDIKGVDHDRARQDKVVKLDGKVKELEEAVKLSEEVSVAFSNEVAKEIEYFQIAKCLDFKEFLGDYTNSQVEFYKKSLQLWESVIPMLEGVKIEDA